MGNTNGGGAEARVQALPACSIIPFPSNMAVRIRQITSRIAKALEEHRVTDLPALKVGSDGCEIRIDAFASIELFPGDPDFRFTLTTSQGHQVLLVTDEAALMADFTCQYVLARMEHRPHVEARP